MQFPSGALAYNASIVAMIWLGAFLSLAGRRQHRFPRLAISFSAGLFLGVSFLHMIPESIRLLGEQAGFCILGGFLILQLLERFVMTHPCEEEECDYHQVGIAAFVGLSLHSLMNGLALGASLLVPGLGFNVFLATLAHKMPESFSLSTLLLAGKRTAFQVGRYVLALSLMVPLGCGIALAGVAPYGEKAIGAAVAVSAGTFLQIATNDLLPETHAVGADRWRTLGSFLLGLALTAVPKLME
ncbi:MAG: ZIP family metal transporter [Pseudomonadota bacterium]